MAGGHTYISKYPNEQGLIDWEPAENKTWQTLIQRQNQIIQNRACEEFFRGLELIKFSHDRIPQHLEVNKILKDLTGWAVEVVPALIPAEDFFTLLANKKFPAASFIRIPEELNYIQEPDIFHEFYGHCPLLTNNDYANFMEEFGKLALKSDKNIRRTLFRLFWFTIEFGLLNTPQGFRAYGGGILSSIGETVYALEDPKVQRVPFDTMTCLRTPYRIDIMQPIYFVLDKFDDLFKILEQDVGKMAHAAKEMGSFEPKFEVTTGEL